MDMSTVISAILGFLAGYGVKVVIDRRRTDKSRTKVDQSGSTVGGNQVGRDIRHGPSDK
jgi:hypothetical protein